MLEQLKLCLVGIIWVLGIIWISGWNLGIKLSLKVIWDCTEEQHFESMPPDTTEKAITQLYPGRVYRFLFSAINEWEAKTTLSPVFTVETRKSQDIWKYNFSNI